MSTTKLLPLAFTMSYDDLISTSIEKEAYLTRDVADLTARGITLPVIAVITGKRVAFAAMPDSVTGIENNTLGYEARDKQVAILFTAVNLVGGIALDTFGAKSAQYKGFQVKGLGKLDCDKLYTVAANVVVKGGIYSAPMTLKGLTSAMLTDITAQAATLLPLISAMPALVGDGETATVLRREAANDLFLNLRGACNTGKAYYKAAGNATKKKEYAIYDKARTVIDRDGTVKARKQTVRKAAGIVATTRVRIKAKTGTSVVVYFGMLKTSPPTASAATVLFNPNIFLDTTAEALGYNLAAGIIKLIIYNPNADDSEFLVKIGG